MVHGKADSIRAAGRIEMINPQYELLGADTADSTEMGRIVPIYEAIGNVSSRMLRRIIYGALQNLSDVLPEGCLRRCPGAMTFRAAATPSASFIFLRRMCRWSF